MVANVAPNQLKHTPTSINFLQPSTSRKAQKASDQRETHLGKQVLDSVRNGHNLYERH